MTFNCDTIQFSKHLLPRGINEVAHFAEVKQKSLRARTYLLNINYNKMCEAKNLKLYPAYRALFGGAFSFPSQSFKKNFVYVSGFSFFSPFGDSGWVHFDKQVAGFDAPDFFKNFIKLKKFSLLGWKRSTDTTFSHYLIYSKNPNLGIYSNNYLQPNNLNWDYRGIHLNYFVNPLTRGADVFSSRRVISSFKGYFLFPVSYYNDVAIGSPAVKFADTKYDYKWSSFFYTPNIYRNFKAQSYGAALPAYAFNDYITTSLETVGNYYKAGAFNSAVDKIDAARSVSFFKFTRKGFKVGNKLSSIFKNSISSTFESITRFQPLNQFFVSGLDRLGMFKTILASPRVLKLTRRRKFFLLRNKGFKRFNLDITSSLYPHFKNKSPALANFFLKSARIVTSRVRSESRLLRKKAFKEFSPVRRHGGPSAPKGYRRKRSVYIRKPSAFKLKSRRPKKGRSMLGAFNADTKAALTFNASAASISSSWNYHYRMARRHKVRYSRGRKFYKGFWSVSWHKVAHTRRRKP